MILVEEHCNQPQHVDCFERENSRETRQHSSILLDLKNKIYGRENEQNILKCAYKKCLEVQEGSSSSHGGGSNVFLITGASGTGKTFLARSLEPMVRNDKGYFLYGKCNQIQHQAASVPYAPFAEAFDQFIPNLMALEDDTLGTRKRLQEAMAEATKESGVAVLTDAIPALKKLQKEASSRQSTEALVSSNAGRHEADIPSIVAFCNFLRAFCSRQAPLVILIDDLQWFDSSSLSLFKALAVEQGNIPGFFLLGTCRGNEVAYLDPLAMALREIEDDHGVSIQDLALCPLSLEAIQEMVKGLIPALPKDQVAQVADLVHHQTKGNAFFATQFLRSLCDTKFLRYDNQRQQWIFECPTKAIPNNLDCAGFCTTNMDNLIQNEGNPALRRVLMVASCLGTEFSHCQIAAACPLESEDDLNKTLKVLERTGMLTCRQEKTQSTLQRSSMVKDRSCFRWAHDRFQQVAYSLIPENDRADFHISVGLNLLRRSSPLEMNQHPFVTVHQFCYHNTTSNTTIPFQTEQERMRLVSLCLAAGQQAALASAFETAGTYLRLGLAVIDPIARAFKGHYELSLSLLNASAEMECLGGNYENVDKLVALVWEHATSFEDKLRAYETQIYSLGSRQDLEGAIHLGLQVLQQLGEKKLRRNPSTLSIIPGLFRTKRRLAHMSAEDIVNLKPLRDWKKAAALRIYHLIIPHTNRVDMNLSIMLATRGIHITLKYGLSEMACFGFFSIGVALCNPLGYVDEGIRAAEMAQAIQETCNAQAMKCRVSLCLWAFCKVWKFPIQESIVPLKEASHSGFVSGDIEMACLCLFCSSCASFLTGTSLGTVEKELADLNSQFSRRHQETLLLYLRILQRAVENLRRQSNSECSRDVLEMDRELEHAREVGDVAGVTMVYMFQCHAAVYQNDAELAKRASKALKKCSLQALNVPLLLQAHFVGGLAEVLGAKHSGKRVGQAGMHALKCLRRIRRDSPDNVLCKIHLIEAEQLSASGKREKALEKYQLAIAQAKQTNMVHEEALAYERAGLSLLACGEGTSGRAFLQKAKTLYGAWGTPLKVAQLEQT